MKRSLEAKKSIQTIRWTIFWIVRAFQAVPQTLIIRTRQGVLPIYIIYLMLDLIFQWVVLPVLLRNTGSTAARARRDKISFCAPSGVNKQNARLENLELGLVGQLG